MPAVGGVMLLSSGSVLITFGCASPTSMDHANEQARVYADANEKLGRSWWDYGTLEETLV